MKHIASISAVMFLASISRPTVSVEPVRTGQETFISNAAFADGRLWLLTDAGTLSTIADGSTQQVDVPLPEPGLDLVNQGGQLLVVTGQRAGGEYWTVRRWSNASWSAEIQVPTNNEALIGVGAVGDTITLVTSGQLVDVRDKTQRTVALVPSRLGSGGVTSTLVTPEAVFVGFNVGEWGGGLRRIDRKTGEISAIESNASGQLCGGPLNTACDPVNGIVAESWKFGCIAVAIGLVHFSAHGRIDEVCGDTVRRIYFKAYGTQPSGSITNGDEPFSTVAFFGLTAAPNDLIAAGIDGLYRIAPDGSANVTALPKFSHVGKVFVSFELPHVVMVLTDVNQRLSLSGSVPLMVVR
jgi:hypothetical protein